jgi:DNA-binding Xre family transcriptional regulator
MIIMVTIKTNLHRILSERRIELQKFAKTTGLSLMTINQLYNDNWSNIDRRAMTQICDKLNISVGELFEVTTDESEPTTSTEEIHSIIDGRAALRKLCRGLGKGPGDLATNHDYYLYGARKRK